MPALTKEMITPGLHIWMCDYRHGNYPCGNSRKPMEFIIVTGEVGNLSQLLISALNLGIPHDNHLSSGREGVYLGDCGISGYTQSKRGPQIFTTREEMQAAINMWAGRNPNCVDAEGNDIK